MKHFLVLIPATLAYACATTPMQLREEGTPESHTTHAPPAAAAACIARNIEELGRETWLGRFHTTVRAGKTPGSTELLATSPDHVHLVADFTPAGQGARASVWIAPALLTFLQARLRGAFTGC